MRRRKRSRITTMKASDTQAAMILHLRKLVESMLRRRMSVSRCGSPVETLDPALNPLVMKLYDYGRQAIRPDFLGWTFATRRFCSRTPQQPAPRHSHKAWQPLLYERRAATGPAFFERMR